MIDTLLIDIQIKSNVGHAEPAAGISGIMKAVMAIEKGIIPGNPTFENPSPKSRCNFYLSPHLPIPY
jgi:3-oxoacyl-(acyl-carrier-protein) synthase